LASPVCVSGKSNMYMNMKHCWDDNDVGKPKHLVKNLSQCQFAYLKSHTDWRKIEPVTPWWEAGD
jgi:hypothetical protein